MQIVGFMIFILGILVQVICRPSEILEPNSDEKNKAEIELQDTGKQEEDIEKPNEAEKLDTTKNILLSASNQDISSNQITENESGPTNSRSRN